MEVGPSTPNRRGTALAGDRRADPNRRAPPSPRLARCRLFDAIGRPANCAASPAGVTASYRGLSRSVGEFHRKDRARRVADADNFWGGVKESEEVQ
jgi:hypothetical protein